MAIFTTVVGKLVDGVVVADATYAGKEITGEAVAVIFSDHVAWQRDDFEGPPPRTAASAWWCAASPAACSASAPPASA